MNRSSEPYFYSPKRSLSGRFLTEPLRGIKTFWLEWSSQYSGRWPLVLVGLAMAVTLSGITSWNILVGLGCGIMLLLMAWLLPRPNLIAYLVIALYPFTGGLERGGVIPGLRGAQMMLAIGFFLFIFSRPSPQGKSRVSLIDFAFFLTLLTSSVFPVLALYFRGDNIGTDDVGYGQTPLQLLVGPLQYYILYRMIVAIISSQKQVRTVLSLLFATSIIVSILGILQKFGVGPVRDFLSTYYPTPDFGMEVSDVNQRITSTLVNWAALGAYLCVTLLIALACYVNRDMIKISPRLLALTVLFDVIALVLTGTMVAWISLVVCGALVFKLSGKWPSPKVMLAGGIGVAIAVVVFMPFLQGRFEEQVGQGASNSFLPASIDFRVTAWTQIFLPAIADNLAFGEGPAPKALNYWPTEESQYLFLLLRGGLPNFISYWFLMGVGFVYSFKLLRRRTGGAERPLAIGTIAILVAINIMNLTAVYFTAFGATQIIWMMLAMVVGCRQLVALGVWGNVEVIEGTVPPDNRTKMLSPGIQTALPAPLLALPEVIKVGSPVRTETDKPTGGNNWMAQLRAQIETSRSTQPVEPATEEIAEAQVISPAAPALEVKKVTGLRRLLDWHFIKDSMVVGVGSTIARLLGLLFSILLARLLTAEDFGFVRYSITLAGILTIVSAASPASVARFLAANPDDPETRNRYYTNGMVGVAGLLAVTLVVSVPVLILMHALDFGTMLTMVGLTAFFSYFALVRGLSNAWKMGLSYIITNVSLIVALLVVMGLFDLRNATIALVIYGLANMAPPLLEVIKGSPVKFRPRLISKAVIWELARFSWPLIVANGAYTIWFGVDMLLVENFTPQYTGSYAAAKTLSLAFVFVPTAITLVLMPKVAAMSLNQSKRYGLVGVGVALLLSLIGVGIIALWGQTVVNLTFGSRYSEAVMPLLVLGIGMTFYSVYVVLEGFMVGHGRPGLHAQAMVVAMLTATLLGLWLTPTMGAVGSSLAFTFGAVVGLIILLFNTRKMFRVSNPAGDVIDGR